jgi:hypothetical protein
MLLYTGSFLTEVVSSLRFPHLGALNGEDFETGHGDREKFRFYKFSAKKSHHWRKLYLADGAVIDGIELGFKSL